MASPRACRWSRADNSACSPSSTIGRCRNCPSCPHWRRPATCHSSATYPAGSALSRRPAHRLRSSTKSRKKWSAPMRIRTSRQSYSRPASTRCRRRPRSSMRFSEPRLRAGPKSSRTVASSSNDTHRNTKKPEAATMITRRASLTLTLTAALLATLTPARAESWPTRPVKIIVAFSPGGSADQFGRLVAQELSATFGQQFYIEYHPGSSGSIGAGLTARATPDGYTLMIGGSGPHITAPAINPNIGYDPIKDFTHIAMIGADGYGLIANPTLGIGNLADLVKTARARQTPLTFSSPGPGSLGQLMTEQFKRKAGIELVHVPAPNSGLMDVLGDHIALSMTGLLTSGEQIKAGGVTAVAVTST